MLTLAKQEKTIIFVVLFAIAAYMMEHTIFAMGQSASLMITILFVGVIILASVRIAHHAEVLAHKVGEPYGTMINV